jgi:dihydrofolate reductase
MSLGHPTGLSGVLDEHGRPGGGAATEVDMAKVLWHATMSLDGFVAGPGDAMDWVFRYPGPNAVADDVVRTTGAILAGRRSYEVGRRDAGTSSAEVYGGRWSGPRFVLTHEPPEGEHDPAITFLSGDVPDAVATALAAAAGRNVVVLGADVARQCIDHGLLDEVVVHLAPVLLGDGVRLFGAAGAAPVGLEKISAGESGQLTDLRFRVGRMKKGSEEVVAPSTRSRVVRACYSAYESGDRRVVEDLIADGFRFSSPADVGIGRERYFERCWPNSATLASFEIKRLHEVGDEVVVTYEAERNDGSRFRNTEVFGFEGDRIKTVEVYFGWNL